MSFFGNLFNWTTGSGWGAYDASQSTRHRTTKAGYVSFAQDEDTAVTQTGRENIRLECRDLRRNNAVVAGICERFADNVVGNGITPQAKTSSEEWNVEAEKFFYEWSKIADYRQRLNLWDIQRLIIQLRMTDGECGFVLVKNGQLQPVEAERIRQPDHSVNGVVDGVAVNVNGIRTGYYVHNRNPDNGMFTGKDFTLVPATDFKHCMRAIRFDQVRGVPELAPVVNSIKDLGDYVDATLEKARGEAKRFYTVENEAGAPTGLPRRFEETDTEQTLEKVETGEIHYLRRGEKLNNVGSDTPGSNFEPFTERVLRMIGSALGLPYEFVLLDFSEGSFSSSRAALLQTYRTFQNWQAWMINGFLQPIWNWRIAKAIKEGQLSPAPVDERGVSEWYKVQWQVPEFGWVDPQSEAQANTIEISSGVSSLTQWARKKGFDAEEMLSEKGRDIANAVRIAGEINAAHPGVNITWKDLITLGIPGQVTSQQANAGKDNEKKKPEVNNEQTPVD